MFRGFRGGLFSTFFCLLVFTTYRVAGSLPRTAAPLRFRSLHYIATRFVRSFSNESTCRKNACALLPEVADTSAFCSLGAARRHPSKHVFKPGGRFGPAAAHTVFPTPSCLQHAELVLQIPNSHLATDIRNKQTPLSLCCHRATPAQPQLDPRSSFRGCHSSCVRCRFVRATSSSRRQRPKRLKVNDPKAQTTRLKRVWPATPKFSEGLARRQFAQPDVPERNPPLRKTKCSMARRQYAQDQ